MKSNMECATEGEKIHVSDEGGNDDENEAWEDPEFLIWKSTMLFLGIEKDAQDIGDEDLLHKEFGTMEQAEKFYDYYSKIMGFSIRKKLRRKNAQNEVILRSWLCSNEGFRENKYIELENRSKEPRGLTRTGCRATLRITKNRNNGAWRVICFRTHHNHPLALSYQKPFLRSNRKLKDADTEQAMLMKRSGIKTCHIWQYMVEQNGGWENVGCVKADLYRGLRQKYGVWDGCDTSTAMGYLVSKKGPDPNFFFKYDTDEEGRLTNLFWADGTCKVDYDLFGDCLSFDSTYKTNRYGKPLVVLLGSNNHNKTCIFGLALLQNESAESYSWILQTFVECMDGKKPTTVLTDGCRSMNKALDEVMPETVHRICSWHIIKNSMHHIHKPGFTKALKRLIFRFYSHSDWENEWIKLKENFELLDNAWLNAQYTTRHMWADSFLRGNYFGGCTATGRCESMNAFLKKDLEESIPLWMFLRHCDNGLAALRYHEMSEDYKTNMTEPLLGQTNMPCIEEQIASIFTRNAFIRVKSEILRGDQYVILDHQKMQGYDVCMVAKYLSKDSKRKVFYSHDGDDVRCSCYWLETKGIPCRHIFATMKQLNKSDIPICIVNKRWLKDAKIIDPSSTGLERKCPHPNVIENSRYGGLTTQSNLVAFYAAKSTEAFNLAMKVMTKLVTDLHGMANETGNTSCSFGEKDSGLPFEIKDPKSVPTKGRPTLSSKASQSMPYPQKKRKGTSDRPRYCKLCGGVGHDSRNCPTKDE